MDFRPDSKTLAINYVITLGIVAGIVMVSMGNTQKYYYSPEYTSHQHYDTPVSCKACHTKGFQAFDQRTCSTGECHGFFGDKRPDNLLAVTKDEKGREKPHFGAILAFHSQLNTKFQCSECHPSHRLPQKGKFNAATMHIQMEKLRAAGGVNAGNQQEKHAQVFHEQAKEFIGDATSCQTCHIAPADEVHSLPNATSCKQCHNDTGNWKAVIAAAGQTAALAEKPVPAGTNNAPAADSVPAPAGEALPAPADIAPVGLPLPASAVPTASSALPVNGELPAAESAVTPVATVAPAKTPSIPSTPAVGRTGKRLPSLEEVVPEE